MVPTNSGREDLSHKKRNIWFETQIGQLGLQIGDVRITYHRSLNRKKIKGNIILKYIIY